MKHSGWMGLAPRREATRPQYGQNSKVSSRMAASDSCTETSTCSPCPVLRRANRAASEGMAAFRPAWKPLCWPNARSGGSSGWAGSPFSVATPPAHHDTRSVAR